MDDTHLTVTLYSHHFSVSRLSPRGHELCVWFAKTLKHITTRRSPFGEVIEEENKAYCSTVKLVETGQRIEFRFHINHLDAFKQHLMRHGALDGRCVFEPGDSFEPESVDFELRPGWAPREEQVPYVEYLCQDQPVSKFVGAQTGFGKTATALFALARKGVRTIAILEPMFMIKWLGDFKKTFVLEDDDILFVKGSEHLMMLLQMGKDERLKEKVIILSNKTYQNWISLYQKYGKETLELGYACLPHELFQVTKSGERLIDEVHRGFHLNFLIDLHTHTASSVSLSATFVTRDPFLRRMYETMHPIATRCKVPPPRKYKSIYAVHYRFERPDRIKTSMRGRSEYSHNALEASVLQQVKLRQRYCEFVHSMLENSNYPRSKHPHKKARIFASSIAMCTELTKYLAAKYPHLSVKRFVQGDPYAHLIEADLCVTTVLSGGTAHDIPGLVTVILTIGIDSIQANLQTAGRLRDLGPEYWGDLHFYYVVCDDVPAHIRYHRNRQDWSKDHALTFDELFSGWVI